LNGKFYQTIARPTVLYETKSVGQRRTNVRIK